MKNIKKILLFAALTIFSIAGTAYASDINLTIRDGSTIVFSDTVPLQPVGSIDVNGHSLDADSVLSVIRDADTASSNFQITNLEYYDSYGSFYLKCIQDSGGEKCDNWQYTVNDSYPGIGMDKKILSGGENVYVYYGPQYRITLDKNEITTQDILTAQAEEYDYQNDSWVARAGVNVGLTQPNPADPWSPTEITTAPVDGSGKAIFTNIAAGSYNVGIKEDFYFPTESLTVNQAPINHGSSGMFPTLAASTNQEPKISPTKKDFNVEKGFEFLFGQQKENGSFGEDIYTDWSAMALAGTDYREQKEKLAEYLKSFKMQNPSLTDYERRAMALMSLGLDPYTTGGENYIQKITSSLNGGQFGDPKEDNDDIFALIVLSNAGYSETDKIINDDVNFLLSKQKIDGSFDESVDMTGAGIVALENFKTSDKVATSLSKAKEYLKQNQKEDGGFGNISSTAWAMEGIMALGEKTADWQKNEKTPLDYLAENQEEDGGIKNEDLNNRIWQTAYSLSALSGKTWTENMQKFEKKETPKSVEVKKEIIQKKTEAKKVLVSATKIEKENKKEVSENNIPETQTKVEIPKKGWFRTLLDTLLSIF